MNSDNNNAMGITEIISTPTITDLMACLAEKQPDEPAIMAPGREMLTYRDAWEMIQHTARVLNGFGLHRGDRVAVVLPNGPEMAMAFLAVSTVATCAPLNPAYRSAEFSFYLSDLNAKAVILPVGSDSPVREVAIQLGITIIELESDTNTSAGIFKLISNDNTAVAETPEFAKPDDISLILHTSGTTSRPKIVPLTQFNLCVSAKNIAQSLMLTPSDRCLNVMPLFHIHGLIGALLSSLMTGASIICTPGFSAPNFFGWVNDCCPTWYTAVPTMHQAILTRAGINSDIIARNHFRFIRSCSAALPPALMAELEEIFTTPVIEAYGMTEASHQIACNPLPPLPHKPGSVGIASGPDIAIMDAEGLLLADNTTGEVVIRGANVTIGYEQNPEANASAFTHGWFRTGDQGYLDAEGYLFLTGRLKELINRGGEKIAPREIDEALLEHSAVAQALAFAIPHQLLGETVAAAVVLHQDAVVQEWELQDFVATRVADFKVPAKIVILDEIPKGPTGKPQRIGLAERLGLADCLAVDTTEQTPAYVAPCNKTETLLTTIWAEMLKLPQIGINDNFFSLGGDSLLAAHVIAVMRQDINVDIYLHHFLTMPTIALQAEWIKTQLLSSDTDDEIDNLTRELSVLSQDEIQKLLDEL